MKGLLVALFCTLLMASIFLGCGQKEAQEDTSAAGQPEEMADTTRMDSAAAMDTMAMPDTTAMEEAAEEATEGGH